MILYVFGNGNLPWDTFSLHYAPQLHACANNPHHQFIVCDFRGADTLTQEFLKTLTGNVHVYHVGQRPRYLADAFRTRVSEWTMVGGFASDSARDQAAMEACTHFLAVDFNSDAHRTSGTHQNIAQCLQWGKLALL